MQVKVTANLTVQISALGPVVWDERGRLVRILRAPEGAGAAERRRRDLGVRPRRERQRGRRRVRGGRDPLRHRARFQGGNFGLRFGLENDLRFHFDSVSCLNYKFLNFSLV